MRQELRASPIWTRKRRFLKSKSTACVNEDGNHFDTLLSNPVCQMVSYAAVRSRGDLDLDLDLARKMNKKDAMDRCKWRKMIKDVR